jgi:hypothetical protein
MAGFRECKNNALKRQLISFDEHNGLLLAGRAKQAVSAIRVGFQACRFRQSRGFYLSKEL